MSHITVVGTLAAEPERRFTNTGKAVASFSMAENHFRKSQSGEYEQSGTTWWRVQVWDKAAENLAETNLQKGARVVVVGRYQTREWEDRDGNKRTSLEITADEVCPSLRFATARVTPTPRDGQPARQRQQEPADNWSGGSSAYSDEPPF